MHCGSLYRPPLMNRENLRDINKNGAFFQNDEKTKQKLSNNMAKRY